MSDITCPFCQVKFPSSELIEHTRLCRQKKNKMIQQKAQLQQQQEIIQEPQLILQQQIKKKPTPIVFNDESENNSSLQKQEEDSEHSQSQSNANVDREECPICNRMFNTDRLEKHKKICEKNQKKQRKIFDAGQQRVDTADPDTKRFVKVVEPKKTLKDFDKTPKVKATKLNWESDGGDAFGNKNANFKAEYDDTKQQKKKDSKEVEKEKIGGDRLNRTPVAKDIKEENLDAKKKKKSRSSDKKDKTDKLKELEELKMMMMRMQQPQVQQPQQPQYQQMQGFRQPEPYQQQQYYQQPIGYQQHYPPPMYAQQQRCRFCVYCGSQYVQDAGFCGICGAKRIEYNQ